MRTINNYLRGISKLSHQNKSKTEKHCCCTNTFCGLENVFRLLMMHSPHKLCLRVYISCLYKFGICSAVLDKYQILHTTTLSYWLTST